MKIYLAGRCDTNWRDAIVDADTYSHRWDVYPDMQNGNTFPVIPRAIFGIHDYMGAFPVDLHSTRSTPYIHGICYKSYNHTPTMEEGKSIQEKCFRAISASDVVFAWLDRDGLYGTVAEITHAYACGKTIYIAYPTTQIANEYWFVCHLATYTMRDVLPDVLEGGYADFSDILACFLEYKHLRTMAYAEYLQSLHWQRMRMRTLAQCAHKCMVCGSYKSPNVHHNTYERRGQELPEDLIVLCRTCHQIFHDTGRLAR